MIHTLLSGVYITAGVVFLFGAAIFVHEFGHFWVARRCGLKVEGFAIGFGPKVFSWTRDGIEYSVRWIPAGGFVKLPQMVTSSAIEGEAKEEKIPPAPPFSKILVAVAGPAMNVVFAFFVAAVIYYVGLPVLVNPSIIGNVDPLSPEGKMGMQRRSHRCCRWQTGQFMGGGHHLHRCRPDQHPAGCHSARRQGGGSGQDQHLYVEGRSQ